MGRIRTQKRMKIEVILAMLNPEDLAAIFNADH
jgi:hypothetical protein